MDNIYYFERHRLMIKISDRQ